MEKASPERLLSTLRILTQDIGIRLSGSANDARATDFLYSEFKKVSPHVRFHEFPVRERLVHSEALEIHIDGEWRKYPSSLFSSVPGTDAKWLEAPLVFFSSMTDYQRPDLSYLRGKAVVHLGCHIPNRESYRRLMEAEPAFLLFVDTRHPGDVPLADGMFPAYTDALGARPVTNVAFADAFSWKLRHADAARFYADAERPHKTSRNVICDLPGSDPDGDIIYLTSHHDTQAGTVGADDNGSGTTIILEIARLMASRPRKRTLRFIAFGAEEQLSVGSACYAREFREEIAKRGRLVLNYDGGGAALGWTNISGCGPKAMFDLIHAEWKKQDSYCNVFDEVSPYLDLFPFVMCGVPGVWIYRPCCTDGCVWHHRFDDDLRHISGDELAIHVNASVSLLDNLANAEVFPFGKDISDVQKEEANTLWTNLYGGW